MSRLLLVLTGKLYLKLLLIIFVGSSAFAENQDCAIFFTQGSRENQTVIRLNINENKIIDALSMNTFYTYEWTVHTKIIQENGNGNKPRGIPCNLQAWKTARVLQNQLQQNQLIIGESGQVENVIKYNGDHIQIIFNNVLIEFGILYTIEVKIIQNDKVIQTKCLEISTENDNINNNKIDSSDDNSENAESKIAVDLELILIGPDQIFSTSALIINAYVVGNNANITFQWKLKKNPTANPQTLNYQGSRLELAGNTLTSARTYEIICDLINNNNILTSEVLKVNVLKPKFEIRLQNKNQSVGINQPIKIIAHVDVPKEIKHEVIWTCTTGTKKCGKFSGTTTLYIGKGFQEPGLYQFELSVTQIDFNERLTAFVEVQYLNRSIEFDEIPTWVKPTERLDIPTRLMNIQSGCTLTWKSMHNFTHNEIDANYNELDISQTNYNRTSAVFINRDAILKELAPYSVDPGNQKITLKIKPELLQTTTDAKYLLRLTTNCFDNIIYADIEIVTNSPPVTTELKVAPLTGDALFTIFRFEMAPAKDKPIDMPVTYYFGWYATQNSTNTTNATNKADEITYFATIQDFYMGETVLPYIKETNGTLGTVISVCDNKDSCIQVQGPRIKVMLPVEMSQENHSTLKNQIYYYLATNDFHKFTTDMLMVFTTYQSLSDLLMDDLQMAVNLALDDKIKYFLDNYNIHKESIYDLISALTDTEHVFKPSSDVLKNLVKLRGKLVHEKMATQIVTDDEREALGVINDINEKDLDAVTVEDIRKYFEATEFIITTSDDPDLVNQEKDNFITNMDKYLRELCVLLYREPEKKSFKFKLQTAYIVLEKFANSYFRNFKYVPNANNEWETNIQIMMNQSWHMSVRDKPMCIGKAVLRNYLEFEGLLYYAQLFSNDMSEFKMEEQPNTLMKSMKTPSKYKCSAYSDGAWHQCRKGPVGSSHLVCMCNKMGYFRIDSEDGSDNDGSGGTGTTENGNNNGTNNGNNGSSGTGNNNGTIGNSTTPGNDSSGTGSGDNGNPQIGNNSTSDTGGNNGNNNGNGSNTGSGSTNQGDNNGESNGGSTSNPNPTLPSNSGPGYNNNEGNTERPERDPDETAVDGGSNGDDVDDIETDTNVTPDNSNGDNNSNTNGNNGGGGGTTSATSNTENLDGEDGGSEETENNDNGSGSNSGNNSGNPGGTPTPATNPSQNGNSGNSGNAGTPGGPGTSTTPASSDSSNGSNSTNANPGNSGNSSDGTNTNSGNAGTPGGSIPATPPTPTSSENNGIGNNSSNANPGNSGNDDDTNTNDDNDDNSTNPNTGNSGNDGTPSDSIPSTPATPASSESGSNGNNSTNTNPENSGNNNGTITNDDNDNNSTNPNPGNSGNGGDGTNTNSGNAGTPSGSIPGTPATPASSENNGNGNNSSNANSGNSGNDDDTNTNDDNDDNSTNPNTGNSGNDGDSSNTNPGNAGTPGGSIPGTPATPASSENGGNGNNSNNTNLGNSGNDGDTNTNSGNVGTPGGSNPNTQPTPASSENDGTANNPSNSSPGNSENSSSPNANSGSSGTPAISTPSTRSTPILSENNSNANNPSNANPGSSENAGGSNTNSGNAGGTTPITRIASPTIPAPSTNTTITGGNPTAQIQAAGSFMSLGDQISFAVIGLCILGTSGLVLFGIVSKRVRKVRAQETALPTYPMYADIFQKENMHDN